ncbi:MAG: acetate kinase, partial [Acidobacteriaceae bacterium]
GVHRYGFHGISCESILRQFEDGFPSSSQHDGGIPARLIIAHLGSGASLTAVRNGKSLDTTMGLTPCGGVLMGTRPGDLDPGVIFYLLRAQSTSTAKATDAIEQMLNKQSGMLALSGLSNDMHLLHDAADHGNSQAALAIEAFVRSVKKVIGGFIVLMGGADAVVFTGGIGEHDASTRSAICTGLEAFGLTLDPTKNAVVQSGARTISRQESTIAVYVLPAEEDRVIAGHVARMTQEP